MTEPPRVIADFHNHKQNESHHKHRDVHEVC